MPNICMGGFISKTWGYGSDSTNSVYVQPLDIHFLFPKRTGKFLKRSSEYQHLNWENVMELTWKRHWIKSGNLINMCYFSTLLLISINFEYASSELLRVTPKWASNWSDFFVRTSTALSAWKFLTTIRNTWKVLKCGGGEDGDQIRWRSCEVWRSVT